jgi:predicted Zn finger-like uncharacterized protein
MNNACPECGAVYAVAEKDIGRRIACKKCNSALIVTEEGLTRDDPPAPRKDDSGERSRARVEDDRPSRRGDDDDDRPRRRRGRDDDEEEERPKRPRGPGLGEYVKKLKNFGDLATWLYGAGLLVTVFAYCAPQFDRATIESRQGEVISAKIDDDADQRDTDNSNDGKPSEDEKKAREKRQKRYVKDTPGRLERISSAEAGALKASWYNVFYRFLGFSLLAFGSILFLVGEQTQYKRILGGVTVLLILFEVVCGGASLHLQTGGEPPSITRPIGGPPVGIPKGAG